MSYEELKQAFIEHLQDKSFTKQKDLFRYIWESSEQLSEISGKPLHSVTSIYWHWQFAHVLPKGVYTHMRLFEYNIMLMLPEEHENQEQYELFNERKEILKQIYHECV